MSPGTPTLLVYGTPSNTKLLTVLGEKMGITLDNGQARDPIFSFYENLARADAILACPNAHPAHLTSLIAEGEVGHPLIVQQEISQTAEGTPFPLKPIVFFGSPADWKPFKALFHKMRAEGLIRDGFDRVAQYESTIDGVITYLCDHLSQQIPATRLHYYNHALKEADLTTETRTDVRPPSAITISFFGSANTKDSNHLSRVHEAAGMCARNDWNILHGGGNAGVMGELSKAGQERKAYVLGISVDFSGAPKIFFEREDDANNLEALDYYIASKDMLHRIETYAGHSEAFIALDGGIGSVQEILVIAELLSAKHPAVMFETQDQQFVPKPLYVLNKNEIYSPLLSFLEKDGFAYLTDHITSFQTVAEIEEATVEFFLKFPPRMKRMDEKASFRDSYTKNSFPSHQLSLNLSQINQRKAPILEQLDSSV